jgi:PAS domain S-box-containing protein
MKPAQYDSSRNSVLEPTSRQAAPDANLMLTQVLEQMDEGFFLLDRKLRVCYWNRRMQDYTGVAPEALLGCPKYEGFSDEARAFYVPIFQEALDTNESIFREFLCPVTNRWTELNLHPSAAGLSVFMKDVHKKHLAADKQRRYELMIRQQNASMVEVLEQMRDAFVTISKEGRVLYWNAQAEALIGIDRKNAIGQNLFDIMPHLRDSPFFATYQRMLANPEPIHREIFGERTQRWIELHAYTTKRGISVFFRDITGRINGENTFRKLSLVAQCTDNIVAITDPKHQITWVNEAFSRITGYESEEVMGKPAGEVFDGPGTDQDIIDEVRRKLVRREPFHIEVLNYKKNGDTYWSEVNCQPVFGANGELLHFFSIARDITERKRLQERLDAEKRQRQQMITAAAIKAQESERALVSQELHDNVNQVLTTVKLYTELCRDGIGDRDELMDKSLRLLQHSISEIRSLSKRLSAPSLGNIKLRDSVKELLDAVSATNKICVCLDTEAIEDLVHVDQDVHLAIYRILQEQLTNILKHAGAGNVWVSFNRSGRNLELRIHDDGKGFDPRRQRQGIGITNMMTRAESVQGFLQIDTAPGQGCTLMMRVPV